MFNVDLHELLQKYSKEINIKTVKMLISVFYSVTFLQYSEVRHRFI